MGFFFGSIIPVPFGSLIGAGIGSFLGKERMERELRDGKEAKEPTLLNRNFFPGYVAGTFIAIGIGLATAAISIPMITSGAIGLLAGTWTLGSILAAAAPLVGGIIGAVKGKEKMAQEYEQAKAETMAMEQSRGQGVQPTTGLIKQQQIDYGTAHPAYQAEKAGRNWVQTTGREGAAPLRPQMT